MRWLLTSVSVFAIFAATAVAQPVSRSLSSTVVGTVRSLDFSHITVGGTSCQLATAKSEALVGNFAVGENVAIGCLRGALRTITLVPITSGPRNSLPFIKSSIVIPKSSGPHSLFSRTYTGGILLENPNSTIAIPGGELTGSFSASGPITSITQTPLMINGQVTTIVFTTITVGNATCSVLGLLNGPGADVLQVGVNAEISCSGLSGAITVPGS